LKVFWFFSSITNVIVFVKEFYNFLIEVLLIIYCINSVGEEMKRFGNHIIYLLFIFLFVLFVNVNYSKKFNIVVKQINENVQWDNFSSDIKASNRPIFKITTQWPIIISNIESKMPPTNISFIMLETEITNLELSKLEKEINQFQEILKQYPNIKYVVLKSLNYENKEFLFCLKKIYTTAKVIIPDIKIGIGINFIKKKRNITKDIKSIIKNKDISPYYHALVLPSLKYKKRIKNLILREAPKLEIWQSLSKLISPEMKSEHIIANIIKSNPFKMINTTLFIIESNDYESIVNPLVNFLSIIRANLYKYTTKTKIKISSRKRIKLNNYIKTSDQSVFFFCSMNISDNLRIYFKKNRFKKIIIKNLSNGEFNTIMIKQNTKQKNIELGKGYYAINLIPEISEISDLNYSLSVSGKYTPSADEIIAKVRIWKEKMRAKLKYFTANMKSSLRLRIANLNKTFDLTISGPMFSERDKPYDWVWKEFYINGVRWKGKKVPKIPLLQPEKVKILPMELVLSEEYKYKYIKETIVDKHSVYVISFKPKKEYRLKSTYFGTLWIDKHNYCIRKEHLIQINLKKEVLSSIENRFYKQVGNDPDILLPVVIKGHQVFSTVGRITNIEKNTKMTNVKINPPNFITQREEAYKTNFQMVRDTSKGMRYLIKDKKSNERKVEWKVKKSQLLWVLGGYSDSSRSWPLPILGVNYLNFDLGGKGRQVNILFGGVILTAYYSDPSLFGSRIDLGANVTAVALPFKNSIYKNNKKAIGETIKKRPFSFNINLGFPLGTYCKFSSSLFLNYNHFSKAKHTSESFTIPINTFTYGFRGRLTANVSGYKFLFWSSISKRNKWNFWGIDNNNNFDQQQQTFYRWRFAIDKDYFLANFKKFHFTLGYFDGKNLDRFSAYKFGFFNEVKMRGFMSGVVQATKTYLLKLDYGYSIGKAFRLELSYDSALVTNTFNDYKNTYFSSTALSGTVNIPVIDMICRFEIGIPIISNGIKGYVVNLLLMKML